MTFNDPSLSGLEGGVSDSIDWRNLILNVNGLFTILEREEAGNAKFNAGAARVQLTITITAHELAHLAGLKHADSYGQIGTGIYLGVDPKLYRGDTATILPTKADETPFHILASGASVDAANVIGQLGYVNINDIHTQVGPDVYAFHANAGELLNAQVFSASLVRMGNSGDGRVNSTDKAIAVRYKDKSKITFPSLFPH